MRNDFSQVRLAARLASTALVALLAAAPALAAGAKAAPPSVTRLRCEYKVDPLGIDATQPRLSWQLRSTERGVVQSAYQVQVTRAGRTLWDTGKVASDRSVHVAYAGPALESSAPLHVARARVGRGRPGLGLERPRLLGDGAPEAGGLEGPLDRDRR